MAATRRRSTWNIASSAVWFGLASAACQAPALPQPEISAILPARVWSGADVPVTIEGANFYPGVEVDARGFGADLDRDWDVFLVGGGRRLPLLGEALESEVQLRGLVPAGYTPGIYTLDLVSPSGVELSSGVTLEVTESQEAGFSVSLFDPPSSYVAGRQVRFQIDAVGLDNARVFEDVPVAVTLTGAAAELSSTVAFDDVELSLGGLGFDGVLPDGSAVLVVDLLAPGLLEVVAASPPGQPELQEDKLPVIVGGGSDLATLVEIPPEVALDGVDAGEPFDVTITVFDELGVVVEEPLNLTLGNRCGGFEADVVVRGATTVPVVLTTATAVGECEDDAVVVERGGVGQSAVFRVHGGEVSSFEQFTLGLELQAGQPQTVALVRPRDAYGNTTTFSGELRVTDDLGSLTDISCQDFVPVLSCVGTPTFAGENVTVRVEAVGANVRGELGGYRILPSADAAELTVVAPATVRAGLSIDVDVEVLDVYGNVQLPEQVDPAEIELSSELGDAGCLLGGVGVDGLVDYSCSFTTARPDGTLTATGFGSLAGLVASRPLAVDNGLLADVSVSAPASIGAGQGFSLGLTARDAFGNPYLVQDDPVVDLSGGSDSLTPDLALLGGDGTATVAASLTAAGVWTLSASQSGLLLGNSDPITVVPASTHELAVRVDAPWGEVGVPVDVVVEAVDAYGNRTTLSESLTVTSALTSTPPQSLALINGVANMSWTWTERAVDEMLDASSSGGFVGQSAPLYVVRDCGGSGPTVNVALGGAPIGLACFDEGSGRGTITADLSGSSAGAFPLVGYGVSAVGTASFDQVGTANVVDLLLPDVGRYAVRAIVVDADACASETTSEAFVGFDDGSPTGPLALVANDAVIDVAASTAIDVIGVTDCAGDPASGASVHLRVSAGVLGGVSPTGEGLAVVLDAVGDGVADLTTSGDVADNGPALGMLSIDAWTPLGTALGATDVLVSGDAVRPTILDQAPRGIAGGLVDTVVLDASENLLPSSVDPSHFSWSGPYAVAVTDANLVADQITLTLSPAADADAGAWLLTISDDVRDEAGNRLSGDWSGDRAPYVGAFGVVGATPDPVSCPTVVPAGAFRPDGDDGEGGEVDRVTLSLESASAPAWWVAEIHDASGTLVVQRWLVPAGPSDEWSWDARDEAGFVVPGGTYTLTVRSDDGFGNRGAGCVVQTTVEHPFEEL